MQFIEELNCLSKQIKKINQQQPDSIFANSYMELLLKFSPVNIVRVTSFDFILTDFFLCLDKLTLVFDLQQHICLLALKQLVQSTEHIKIFWLTLKSPYMERSNCVTLYYLRHKDRYNILRKVR